MRAIQVLLLCFLGLTSCSTMVCACLEPTAAVIAGQVTVAGGEPLASATVHSRLSPGEPNCVAGAVARVDSTDAVGRYRTTVIAFKRETKCVFVEVQPPAGSALRDTVVGPFLVTLHGDRPLDHLVLDVVLSP